MLLTIEGTIIFDVSWMHAMLYALFSDHVIVNIGMTHVK